MRPWMVLTSIALLAAACSRATDSPTAEHTQATNSAEPSNAEPRSEYQQPQAQLVRPRPQPTPGVLDTSYVTAEFFGAIAIHPRRLAESDVLSALPLDELLAGFVGSTGVDPRQVEQLMFLVAPTQAGSEEMFMPAAVIRFSEPVDGRVLLSRMWGEVESRTVSDMTYFRQISDLATTPAAFLPNDQTMVIGAEATMLQMVSNPTDTTPLAQRMKATSDQAEVVAVFVTAPVRDELTKFVEGALPQYGSVPQDLNSASLFMRVNNESLLEVNFEGDDADSSQRLMASAQEAVQVIQGAYGLMMRPAILDAIGPELGGAIEKPMDEAMQHIEVTQQGQHVQMVMKRPPSMDSLPAALADAIARFREQTPQAAAPLATPTELRR